MSRRGALDRVVDLAVAVPTCTLIAARRAVPIAARLGARGSARLVETVSDVVAGRAGGDDDLPPPADGKADREVHEATSSTTPGDVAATIAADELAIDGYDDLAARQIVDRLDDLGTADLARIEVYEREHRSRSTVLGKIAMLTG